mmetsp:Transcript_23111/g.55729  ORF Transcript_23111/g.55729 Transcript_23111/m.55729 type:complete len:172 (-) Transcript_23111:490-1005(-)
MLQQICADRSHCLLSSELQSLINDHCYPANCLLLERNFLSLYLSRFDASLQLNQGFTFLIWVSDACFTRKGSESESTTLINRGCRVGDGSILSFSACMLYCTSSAASSFVARQNRTLCASKKMMTAMEKLGVVAKMGMERNRTMQRNQMKRTHPPKKRRTRIKVQSLLLRQ